MKNEKLRWVGIVASILGLFSFARLLIHNYKVQDTQSLSWDWLLFNVVIQILWGSWAYANHVIPVLITIPIYLGGLIYLTYLKTVLETNIMSKVYNNNVIFD
jgi:uncharacterized protein with PQ loop repeat